MDAQGGRADPGEKAHPVGAARHHRGRSDVGAGEVQRLHQAYAATGDRRIREQLFRHYDDFAVHLARRFPSRRERTEDLVQVARIGLLHAIDRFDPGRDRAFKGFAQATISGELKRHIRDHTWVMRVPRSLQEHYLAVMRAVDDLTQERGRSPRIPEVADRCGLREEQVIEAMELQASHRPVSLDVPSSDGERRTREPAVIAGVFDDIETRAQVGGLMASMPAGERGILRLRFVENLTQAEIAERVGRSQMYVSRLLGRTLERMRTMANAG